MLLALALGAFAAAFAAPFLLPSDDDEEDPDLSEPEMDGNAPSGSLLEFAEGEERGQDFELAADPGDFLLENFDPETDRCIITVEEIDVLVETGWDGDGTPFLKTGTVAGPSTVAFPDLGEVPTHAVTFCVPASDDGEAVSLSLSDVLDLGTPAEVVAETTTYLLDGGPEHPADVFEETLADLEGFLPVLPGSDDLGEGASGLLDLFPLAPGAGDEIDDPTEPPDGLLPISPGYGETTDVLPVPLTGIVPVAPNSGDEADG